MKWEYLVIGVQNIRADCQRIFSNYGKEGWELVTVKGETAYFKRPIPDIKLEPEFDELFWEPS